MLLQEVGQTDKRTRISANPCFVVSERKTKYCNKNIYPLQKTQQFPWNRLLPLGKHAQSKYACEMTMENVHVK